LAAGARIAGGTHHVIQTALVTFRQQLGPAASSRSLQELLALVKDAGYADFRAARGPMGLTQRQGIGKFTQDEVDGLIEQLQVEDISEVPPPLVAAPECPLQQVPSEQLAAELRLRGWLVRET